MRVYSTRRMKTHLEALATTRDLSREGSYSNSKQRAWSSTFSSVHKRRGHVEIEDIVCAPGSFKKRVELERTLPVARSWACESDHDASGSDALTALRIPLD